MMKTQLIQAHPLKKEPEQYDMINCPTKLTLVLLLAVAVCGFSASDVGNGSNTNQTAEAYLARGDGYFASREYGKAIVEYTRAIELKPDFAEAYNNRAYATYSKYDGTGDPLADLNRAISLRPDFPHAYNTRGCVYMAAGQPDKAIADFGPEGAPLSQRYRVHLRPTGADSWQRAPVYSFLQQHGSPVHWHARQIQAAPAPDFRTAPLCPVGRT